jgi:hypothetical protein
MQNILHKTKDFLFLNLIRNVLSTNAFEWKHTVSFSLSKYFFVGLLVRIYIYIYVSLTLHLSITLANDQHDAQFFNTFITIFYMYMFRAISCSSSGGKILLIQHLVSSLSVSDRLVHRCTGRSLTESDDTRCCTNTIWPPEYEQDIARNM